jgi:hypothetical protein
MQVVRRGIAIVAFGSSILGIAPLAAQGRSGKGGGIPPGHLPPPGMCRVWIDGVPPGRQPAPTDCATARRRAPRYARVVYGPPAYHYKKGKHRKHRHDHHWDHRRDRVIVIPDGGRRRVESTTVCISHDRTGVCIRQAR